MLLLMLYQVREWWLLGNELLKKKNKGKFKATTIQFKDVTYVVRSKDQSGIFKKIKNRKKKLTILNSISGHAKPGEILSVMGHSGSGKTTLMDILFGRAKEGTVSGEILVNGQRLQEVPFTAICGYVQQEDNLFPSMTVKEQLMYCAELRLPESINRKDKIEKVEAILTELNLQSIKNRLIGGRNTVWRGLSGGERKRVHIACELITNPSVLLLDEPTSGLDAHNSAIVMETIQKVAASGRTVITTIHQPRSSVFATFHKLLLLHQGNQLFFGPTSRLRSYLDAHGHKIPDDVTSADYVIDHCLNNPDSAASFAEAFRDSEDFKNIEAGEEQSESATSELKLLRPMKRAEKLVSKKSFNTSFLKQFWVLYRYALRNMWRDVLLIKAHFVFSVACALFLGFVYFDVTNGIEGFQNRLGSVFFSLVLLGFANLSVIDVTFSERHMFENERARGYYRVSAYYLSRVITQILMTNIFFPLVYSVTIYWIIGYQNTAEKFFIYLSGTVLTCACTAMFMMCISFVSPTQAIATLTSTVALLFVMLFGGFLVNQDTIPEALRWIRYISVFHYGYEAILTSELDGLTINIAPRNLDFQIPVPGEFLIETLGMDADQSAKDLYILCGFISSFFILGYIVLRIFRKEKK